MVPLSVQFAVTDFDVPTFAFAKEPVPTNVITSLFTIPLNVPVMVAAVEAS